MEREDIKMLVKKWWDIYNDPSLDYEKQLISTGTEAQQTVLNGVEVEPFVQSISEVRRVRYVTAPSAA